MSAVLGPIHEWMYGKIKTQENITKAVYTYAIENGWDSSDSSKTLADYVKEEFPRLEEAIDLGNIHGSLAGMIDGAESRYANLVANILKGDDSRIQNIEHAVYEFGVANSIGKQNSASDAYEKINEKVLDGMPCDRCMEIVDISNENVKINRAEDLHGMFWEAAGLSRDVYYRLRKAFIEGLMTNSGYSYKEDGDAFVIC